MEQLIYNLLFINQPQSEYGQSLLFHGLRSLGHKVCAKFLSSFHYTVLRDCKSNCSDDTSPCKMLIGIGCNNHPAHLTLPREFITKDEKFDLVITNNGYGNEELHRHIYKAGIPIAALDLGDSSQSSYNAWCNVIGDSPNFFFRREYYPGQKGTPLSYSFYEDKSKYRKTDELSLDVSCLYRPTNSSRKEIASKIQQNFENSFVGQKPHNEYLETISRSKFSVALTGAGHDTLRHWEIPSQGAVLCKPWSPIQVNNDFVGGKNCIEFRDADDLISQIKYYLNPSNEMGYNKLRENCFNHFLKYHTTKARAKEFLNACGLREQQCQKDA